MPKKNNEFILWLMVALSATVSIIGALPFAVSVAGKLSMIATSARLLLR